MGEATCRTCEVRTDPTAEAVPYTRGPLGGRICIHCFTAAPWTESPDHIIRISGAPPSSVADAGGGLLVEAETLNLDPRYAGSI